VTRNRENLHPSQATDIKPDSQDELLAVAKLEAEVDDKMSLTRLQDSDRTLTLDSATKPESVN
jgi:hypothetical protein